MATSVPALTRVLHWHRCWAEETGYAPSKHETFIKCWFNVGPASKTSHFNFVETHSISLPVEISIFFIVLHEFSGVWSAFTYDVVISNWDGKHNLIILSANLIINWGSFHPRVSSKVGGGGVEVKTVCLARLSYITLIFTHLTLCLAIATHNVKWVKTTQKCFIWYQIFVDFYNGTLISFY